MVGSRFVPGTGMKTHGIVKDTIHIEKYGLGRKTFLRDATDEEKKSIYEEKAILFNQYNDGKAMQGAAEVLKKVKASGLQTLVVTGSGQHSLINKLEHTYPGYFKREKMVTAFDVK